MKIQVHIVSREVAKPSSPTVQHKKPYKLCLFDQLTPTTYSTVIFFYPVDGANSNDITRTRIDRLKKSLSETLNIFYHLSGRVKDNLFIDSFDDGVPFFEAQVNCRLSDFLKHYEIESLNHLLPCQPFTKEDMNAPPVAIQLNVFTCGGIAVSGAASHKIVDGATSKDLFRIWASICRGDCNDHIKQPDFEQASLFFPPRNSLPQNHLSLMETLWFTEANYITRRFVFNANAIATLKAMVKAGKPDAKTSRIQTLTCFIWKSFMAASRAISGSPKPSILVEAVDLRSRTKPPMSYSSTGNAIWWATALVNPMGTKTELPELVNKLNEATALYDSDYSQTLQGEEGFETMSEYCNQLEELFSLEMPDLFAFTSWYNSGFTQTNFGWGEPFWVGLMGKVGPAFRNLTVLIQTRDGKGIEAWITLDEERMTILEHDPEFLAFASPNPKISSL